MWVNFYGIPLTLFDTRITCTVPHYCVTNRYNIANVNAVGVAFKASNEQALGRAMRRTARCSFAYRHTSERVSQHYYIRRANLQYLLISNKLIYVLQFTPMAILVFYCRVVFQCLTTTFSGRLRARPCSD
jgi:hypothetical protein